MIALLSFWESIARKLEVDSHTSSVRTPAPAQVVGKRLIRDEKTFKEIYNTRIWIQVSWKGENDH